MELTVKNFNELTTRELYEILKSRCEVFFLEQKIFCQDMDDMDYKSLHFFFMEKGRVAAYLRAFYKNEAKTIVKLGRVLTLAHGNGLGRKLMNESLSYIKDNMKCDKLYIEAQKHAQGFYEKFGFKAVSDEFLEEGIPHVAMEMEL